MNVFVMTDVEGIPGVTSITQLDRTKEEYKVTRMKLCRAIGLVYEACKANGADTVYVLDGHGGGGNVIAELLDEDIVMTDLAMLDDLLAAGKIDCVIELGSHARAGTVGGFLDHTTNSKRYFRYTVNDEEYGEFGIHAALYGAFGVPVAVCIGDEAACRQAKEYVPEVVTAAVKHGTTRNECEMHPDADERIKEAVALGLKRFRDIPPMRLSMPLALSLTYYRTDYLEEAYAKCKENVTRVDARTLSKTVEHISGYGDFRF